MRFLFLLLLPFLASSQDIIFNTISVDDGLPSSEVYCIAQDNLGYIWIGTDNGLAKYDGKKFQNYTINEGLADNTVIGLLIDSENRLWVIALNGKIKYIKNGKIVDYQYTLVGQKESDYSINALTMVGTDEEGYKWLSNNKNDFMLKETKSDSFEKVDLGLMKMLQGSCFVYYLKPIENNSIIYDRHFIGIDRDDYSIRKENDFILLEVPSTSYSDCEDIYEFIKLSSGNILGENKCGDYVIFNTDSIIDNGNLGINNSLQVYEDQNNNCWITSRNGVAFYEKGNFKEIPQIFFADDIISNMLQDHEGNYWFTNHDKGLHKVSSINFREYVFSKPSKSPRISSLKVRNGELWLSTIKGQIWKINSQHQSELIYKEERQSFDFYPFEVLYDGSLYLPGDRYFKNKILIRDIIEPYTNYKYFELYDNTLVFVGHSTGYSVQAIKSEFINPSIKNAKEKPVFSSSEKLNYTHRTNTLLTEGDSLWLGSVNGLYLHLLLQDTIIDLGKSSPLLRNRVMSIKTFNNNYLILGTKGSGVILLNKNTHETHQINSSNGLPSDLVKCIFVKNNFVFVGTNRGLSVIELDEIMEVISIKNYDINNGLPSNEISDIAFYNNKIWLGTNNGLIYFDENKLKVNDIPPPVYITEIVTADSNYVATDSLLNFSSVERNVTFLYNGIGFRAGNRLKYKCYLEGITEDTIYTSSTEVRYTNLSSGNHTFYVWAMNEDGYWSTKPAMATISIPQLFKETILFMVVLIVLGLLFLAGIFYLFYARYRTKLKANLQTTELKQQALTAFMNPHFIYNSLAAIQHFVNTGENEKSNLYISQFSRLIRLNLNSVRSGSIRLEYEIERLKLYLEIEKMRFGDNLSYDIKYEDKFEILEMDIPSMLIQPFVENAIWHGILPKEEPGNITVTFAMASDDRMEVTIRDNGVGLSKSKGKKNEKHHTSMSMEITNERLSLLRQQTGKEYKIQLSEISKEKGGGTIVFFSIPVISD